jgi:hypothetical protein
VGATTVTVKVPVAVLCRVSLAVHVTVVMWPAAKLDPDDGLQVTGLDPSTRSMALAAKLTDTALEPGTVIFAGRVNTGGVVSTTVTVNVPVEVLCRVSLAEQLTVVVPRAKVDPEAGRQVTGL